MSFKTAAKPVRRLIGFDTSQWVHWWKTLVPVQFAGHEIDGGKLACSVSPI